MAELNKGIEERFHPDHLADLRKSGLSDETIFAAGIKTIPPRDIAKRLGFDIPVLSSIYEIPYPGCDGYSRFKAFYDKNNLAAGNQCPKYLARKDSGNHLYVPAMVVSVLKDSTIPLYIIEGEKKALKAAQEGLPSIAIAGLWNWKVKNNNELIPDFDLIVLEGRTIYIVPDNDFLLPDRKGGRKNLKQAVSELAYRLIDKGAKVSWVELPGGEQ